MVSMISGFSEKLSAIKSEIEELKAKLERNESARESLKIHVKTYQQLSEDRKNIKREIREREKKLEIILDFIKESTGEDTYAMFPLFAERPTFGTSV